MTTLIPKFDLKNGTALPTGAVNRPFNLKLEEMISVKDFGAVGNGITNDAPAFQACVNAVVANNGGTIYIPSGNYLLNTTVNIAKSGVWIQGAGSGEGGSWIINGTTSGAAIQFGDGVVRYFNNGVSNCVFGQAAGVTPTSTNVGLAALECSNLTLSNVQVFQFPAALYNGIQLVECGQSYLQNIAAQNCISNGITLANDCFDIYVVNSRADDNGNAGWLILGSQGLYFTNCTAYANDVNAWQIATISTYDSLNLFFENCVGDTSGADNWAFGGGPNIVRAFFLSNCWGSSNQSTSVNTSAHGFVLNGNVLEGNFVNCAALDCNGYGLNIFQANKISVIGGQWGTTFNPNGKSGTGQGGIIIGNSAQNIVLDAVKVVGNLGPGIAIGTATNVNISGGMLLGNTSTITLPQNANSIRNVNGFNPFSVVTPAIPASGVAYTNNTGVDCNVYLSSGTVTQIQVNGVFVLSNPSATIFLPAGSTITLIYSVAPIWIWVGN